MINNYKNEYQKSELPTHSKSISSFFKKDINYLNKEINDEYKFNMKSLLDFSKNKFFNITKLETIQEPKEFKFDNKLILENQNIKDIDVDSININNIDSVNDNSNDNFNDNYNENKEIVENEENELNRSKTIIDIEPSINDLNNKNFINDNTNKDNDINKDTSKDNNTNNLNYGLNQEYCNSRYEELSFTETCMFKAMNMYIEVSNFFFSVKQKVIRNFNYYFGQNNHTYD